MEYNWKEIFENKSTKELYDIISEKIVSSNEAIHFAKLELEKRDFDINNIEAYYASWKLANLIVDADNTDKVIKVNESKKLTFKELFFLLLGLVILYFLLKGFTKINVPIEYLLLSVGVAIFYMLFSNFFINQQKKAQTKRIENIKELKKILESSSLLMKDSPIQKEIQMTIVDEKNKRSMLKYIVIGIVLIYVLVSIINLIIGK